MRILFLCTGNSCRSQMAEGWARHLKKGTIEASSAGIVRHGMNPYAVRVMEEAGVDMSGLWSKTLDDLSGSEFDVVVTLCGHARETCPFFPGTVRRVHRGFDDPPGICAELSDEAEILSVYRRVRDQIREFIDGLPESLEEAGS
jgi:arsenate reductase